MGRASVGVSGTRVGGFKGLAVTKAFNIFRAFGCLGGAISRLSRRCCSTPSFSKSASNIMRALRHIGLERYSALRGVSIASLNETSCLTDIAEVRLRPSSTLTEWPRSGGISSLMDDLSRSSSSSPRSSDPSSDSSSSSSKLPESCSSALGVKIAFGTTREGRSQNAVWSRRRTNLGCLIARNTWNKGMRSSHRDSTTLGVHT